MEYECVYCGGFLLFDLIMEKVFILVFSCHYPFQCFSLGPFMSKISWDLFGLSTIKKIRFYSSTDPHHQCYCSCCCYCCCFLECIYIHTHTFSSHFLLVILELSIFSKTVTSQILYSGKTLKPLQKMVLIYWKYACLERKKQASWSDSWSGWKIYP